MTKKRAEDLTQRVKAESTLLNVGTLRDASGYWVVGGTVPGMTVATEFRDEAAWDAHPLRDPDLPAKRRAAMEASYLQFTYRRAKDEVSDGVIDLAKMLEQIATRLRESVDRSRDYLAAPPAEATPTEIIRTEVMSIHGLQRNAIEELQRVTNHSFLREQPRLAIDLERAGVALEAAGLRPIVPAPVVAAAPVAQDGATNG